MRKYYGGVWNADVTTRICCDVVGFVFDMSVYAIDKHRLYGLVVCLTGLNTRGNV
jgi:hypothetical protein